MGVGRARGRCLKCSIFNVYPILRGAVLKFISLHWDREKIFSSENITGKQKPQEVICVY